MTEQLQSQLLSAVSSPWGLSPREPRLRSCSVIRSVGTSPNGGEGQEAAAFCSFPVMAPLGQAQRGPRTFASESRSSHQSSNGNIQRGFEFSERLLVLILAAEQSDDLDRRAELVERLHLQDVEGLDGSNSFVGVFVE